VHGNAHPSHEQHSGLSAQTSRRTVGVYVVDVWVVDSFVEALLIREQDEMKIVGLKDGI